MDLVAYFFTCNQDWLGFNSTGTMYSNM